MSLMPCPECKRQISSAAEACPQCGHPVVGGSDARVSDAGFTAREEHEYRNARSNRIWWGIIGVIFGVVGLQRYSYECVFCDGAPHPYRGWGAAAIGVAVVSAIAFLLGEAKEEEIVEEAEIRSGAGKGRAGPQLSDSAIRFIPTHLTQTKGVRIWQEPDPGSGYSSLRGGTEVMKTEELKDWVLVVTSEGDRGWVRAATLVPVDT